MAEVSVTIIAASTPILRALFPRSKEARMASEERREERDRREVSRIVAAANLPTAQRTERESSLSKKKKKKKNNQQNNKENCHGIPELPLEAIERAHSVPIHR